MFDIGEFIKTKRGETGESQPALAKSIGVGKDTIVRWEKNYNAPGEEHLRKLERHWGLEPEWLVAQKFLNLLEAAGVDPSVIVKFAPKKSIEHHMRPEPAKTRVDIEAERLLRARNWEAVAQFAMRQMRNSAVARAVHVLEDSMPEDEIARRLKDAGVEYSRASELPMEDEPKPKAKKRGKG